MSAIKSKDKKVYNAIRNEVKRQNDNLELIASENYATEAVLEAQGSVLTNKYAEGYPQKRWYGGCEHVDTVESLAIERAKKVYKAEHANVQPHSGSSANMAVLFSQLKFGDKVLAMNLACGGHLTHGHPLNFSGKYFTIIPYSVDRKTEKLDYDNILYLAKKHRPKLLIAGASAYSRTIDAKKLRSICDKTHTMLMVDMAHIAGLVAAGYHPNPTPYAEFVTSTTHKTLCGPRSGFILCKNEFAKSIDYMVFPGLQGGPLMHIIAAKAVAFKEAQTDRFKKKQLQTIKNAKALSDELKRLGYRVVSGGTDNHMLLVDVFISRGVTGKEASAALDKARITVNKNLIPYDTRSPFVTSGIRLGSPALTTRGMKESQMRKIARLIDMVLSDISNKKKIKEVREAVSELTKRFPIYKGRKLS
ncbi:MAG: serine hydroxymethyltransferase [Candidatus Omnitrophica bacterium]|nr:serine hydroxymethyltransferase [Candidatus Omnitrophota bacterium]